MTTADHRPEPWYWEAGSDRCPHGLEPDDDSPEWDAWYERHTGSPQDVRICLDAPAGDVCETCSGENGEAVPWSACRTRHHVRPKQGMVPAPDGEHQPVVVLVGTYECLDRECEEYFTDDGDSNPGVEHCSHIREEVVCSCQRQDDGEYSSEPCPAARTAGAL